MLLYLQQFFLRRTVSHYQEIDIIDKILLFTIFYPQLSSTYPQRFSANVHICREVFWAISTRQWRYTSTGGRRNKRVRSICSMAGAMIWKCILCIAIRDTRATRKPGTKQMDWPSWRYCSK